VRAPTWRRDATDAQQVVNKRFYQYPKAAVTRQRISRVLGDGLVWAEGEDHMRQRRVMTPSFVRGGLLAAASQLTLRVQIRARIRDQYHYFETISNRLREAIRREIGGQKSAILNMNDIISRAVRRRASL
jgi:cytochrome P450